MSSVKCIGAMAALGAAATGGLTLYKGMKSRKAAIALAEQRADKDGRIKTGGMTKDGALWDGFTTVNDVKKDTKKAVSIAAGISTVMGAITTAAIAGLTLLAKAKVFK